LLQSPSIEGLWSPTRHYQQPAPHLTAQSPPIAFYRFDNNGKLTSERIVMNLGPLQP
jgi:hypothetical protein